MKKNILLVGALAIVALAAFNLNISLDKDSRVNVKFASMFSVAEEESGQGAGKCETICQIFTLNDCMFRVIYTCVGGKAKECRNGDELNNECPPYDQNIWWEYKYCP